MRRRLIGNVSTGLGNPEPELLNNEGSLNKKFARLALKEYFQHWEGFDFLIKEDKIVVGIEASYQYDKVRLVTICKNKEDSSIYYGKALGAYGSKVLGKGKVYKDYKTNSKFKKFCDKVHPILFGDKNEKK